MRFAEPSPGACGATLSRKRERGNSAIIFS
jgi:hypothetical protein